MTERKLAILAAVLVLLIGVFRASTAEAQACNEARTCNDKTGATVAAVLFPETKLARCEHYKRKAGEFDALQTQAEALKRTGFQCTGALEASRSDLAASRAEVSALVLGVSDLRAQAAQRWAWQTWLAIGVALGASATGATVFYLWTL